MVAADQDGLRRAVRPIGAEIGLQEIAQRRPDGRLDDADHPVRVPDRGQHAARLGLSADLPEPARAVPGDEGHVRERLHVLNERRCSAHPPLEDPGRREGRQGQTAVEHVDQGGLLTRQETRGRPGQPDRHPVDARQPALGQRLPQRRRDLVTLAVVQVKARLLGADRLGGELDPVQHQVRRQPEQRRVLAGRRLTLRAVGDDERPPARPGDRLQLPVRREGGPATAGQPGGPQVRGQLKASIPVGDEPVPGQVLLEPLRRAGTGGQQPRETVGGEPERSRGGEGGFAAPHGHGRHAHSGSALLSRRMEVTGRRSGCAGEWRWPLAAVHRGGR